VECDLGGLELLGEIHLLIIYPLPGDIARVILQASWNDDVEGFTDLNVSVRVVLFGRWRALFNHRRQRNRKSSTTKPVGGGDCSPCGFAGLVSEPIM
jgi:hypothetical protein